MSSNNSLIGDWKDWFPLHYAAMSHKNGARRRRRREAATARRAQGGAATLTDDQRASRDFAIDRARSRHAAVAMRLEKGFRWLGGAIGGNPLYARPAAVHPGLVSDDAAILQLFVTKVPRAASLQTGDTKRLVDGTDSKLLALDCPYVVVNGLMRGVLRVEVDAILASWQEIPTACQAAGLHPPNVAVGYVDALGRVINPHLLWIIEHSVAFIGSTRTPQRRLFDGVLRGLTAALIPLGADTGGLSNALRMKNPVSPLWDREIFAQNPYTLTDLCRHVDLYGKAAELQVQCPKARQSVPDHPDAEIAVQSNQPFRDLTAWAHQNVDRFRGAGIPLQTFQDAVEDEALRIYREFDSTSHRIERLARNTAQSVARWTWQNYHRRKLSSRPAITADALRARQATAGSATAAKRRASTESAILEAASLLAKHSATAPTQSALIAATGKSERTIRRYWPRVIAHVAAVTAKARSEPTPATRWRLEKKLTPFVAPHQPGKAKTTTTTNPSNAPTNPPEAAQPTPQDRPAPGAAPAIPRPRPLSPVDPGFDRHCSGARHQPAAPLSRSPPAPPVHQAVRHPGLPALHADQPASPDPAISGALTHAPPPATSPCTTGRARPHPATRPPIETPPAASAARTQAHARPQPPILELAAVIAPEEYAALLRESALAARPPDPVVIHVDPRLLHDVYPPQVTPDPPAPDLTAAVPDRSRQPPRATTPPPPRRGLATNP